MRRSLEAVESMAFLKPKGTKLLFCGPQAAWFLDQLLTNKLDELQAGEQAEALLLTPKGRIVRVMKVLAGAEELLVDAGPGDSSELLLFFQSRVFTTQVEIDDVSEQ